MGSSDNGAGMVDCSVGTIVWVRRRNGSWWPGKILGPDELSAAHLMSPRSGTPVKLLGREDASVDWYNLEKSKRVKAFRCGEFDDCIERAESSQGMPPKKREKYARREDAIIHALELEKQLLEKKYGKLGCSSNGKSSKSSDAAKKESLTSSECLGYGNGKHVPSKSHQLSKRLDTSLEDKNMDRPLYTQKVKEGNQASGEDDSSEVITRMRGLQDFGLRIAPSKQKISSSVASNDSQKPACDNNAHALPSDGLSPGNPIHPNSKNSLDKRKRSHEGLAEESLVKRRDRRRRLVQVLQSSTKLPVSHSLQPGSGTVSLSMSGEEEHTGVMCRTKRSKIAYLPGEPSDCLDDKVIHPNQMEMPPSPSEESNCPHPAALSEENTSGSMEDTETDSVDSDTDEEMMAFSDAVVPIELEQKSLGRSEAQVEHGSMSSEEPDDLTITGDMSHISPHDPVSASVGVSKWQLKGKRNNRSLTKRSVDIIDRKVSIGSIYGTNLEEEGSNGCDEADAIEKNFRTRAGGFDNRGYSLTSKSTSRGLDSITRNVIDWEDLAWNDQPALKGFWEDSGDCFDPVFVGRHHFGGRMKSMLVDVNLKVQSSYQREHVPMISLMSKLNGKAIVGHPIQIEALENGSSEFLLSAADDICPETLDNDTALPPPPVWRTARRTANFRVPRPRPSTTLDGDETAENVKYFNQDGKVVFKKSNVGSFGHKASAMRKSHSHVSRPPVDKKFSRKLSKKISLSSSQKTRTLSSIATERKLSNDPKHGSNSYQVDGLIKPESGPTAVACIPVKLVFSRLHEELVGRHQ
uniref:PWWP domain-containing protein n=1 Tax=Davidia involucrata TaxID=16924 RepID=A0A5B7A098_DAVIN